MLVRMQLAAAARRGAIVINPVIYSEFSVRYERIEDVDYLLPEADYPARKLTLGSQLSPPVRRFAQYKLARRRA